MRSRLSVVPSNALIDTSAYYALADEDDANYPIAQAILTNLASTRSRLFTTNYVLAETHALLLTRLGYKIASKFLQEIDRSATTVMRATVADEQRARAIIYRQRDKDFSLTDAITFSVMERLHLTQAFSFDRHFAQYGFTALTP